MASVEYFMNILSNNMVYKTEIPTSYLAVPEIQFIITQRQWTVYPCRTPGWCTLQKMHSKFD